MNKKESKLKVGLIAGRQKKSQLFWKKECMLISLELLFITCNKDPECGGSKLTANFPSWYQLPGLILLEGEHYQRFPGPLHRQVW